MRTRLGLAGMLALVAVVGLVPVARQASAFTLVERGGQGTLLFRTIIAIDKAVITDGTHQLAPGRYDVEVFAMGDGSVRAVFSQGGAQKGAATGRLERGRPNVNAQQVVFQPQGQSEILEIGSPGMDRVLFGLLLPAVQKAMGDGSRAIGGAGGIPIIHPAGAKGSAAAGKEVTPH
jgi:hypothetical protein